MCYLSALSNLRDFYYFFCPQKNHIEAVTQISKVWTKRNKRYSWIIVEGSYRHDLWLMTAMDWGMPVTHLVLQIQREDLHPFLTSCSFWYKLVIINSTGIFSCWRGLFLVAKCSCKHQVCEILVIPISAAKFHMAGKHKWVCNGHFSQYCFGSIIANVILYIFNPYCQFSPLFTVFFQRLFSLGNAIQSPLSSRWDVW